MTDLCQFARCFKSCTKKACMHILELTFHHRAHGVMVSHLLPMRKALGSIPSVSISLLSSSESHGSIPDAARFRICYSMPCRKHLLTKGRLTLRPSCDFLALFMNSIRASFAKARGAPQEGRVSCNCVLGVPSLFHQEPFVCTATGPPDDPQTQGPEHHPRFNDPCLLRAR